MSIDVEVMLIVAPLPLPRITFVNLGEPSEGVLPGVYFASCWLQDHTLFFFFFGAHCRTLREPAGGEGLRTFTPPNRGGDGQAGASGRLLGALTLAVAVLAMVAMCLVCYVFRPAVFVYLKFGWLL